MTSNYHPKLKRLYNFFETYGTDRLNGLDESYFKDLNFDEREEAWNFLIRGDSLSEESINGLFLLDKTRAINLFKKRLESPINSSPYPAQRKAFEINRLLLLSHVNNAEPSKENIDAMARFADSEFSNVRAAFAETLPTDQITVSAINALKKIIFTETERVPLSSAITKYMEIHGLDYQIDDPLYNSIYMSLRSGTSKQKTEAINRIEKMKPGNYV